jgi:hypothetical protein
MNDMVNEPNERTGCVSSLMLDRLVASELLDAERRSVMEHVDGCPRCRDRLSDIVRGQKQFLERAPSLRIPITGARGANSRRAGAPHASNLLKSRWRAVALGGSLAAAVASVSLFALRPGAHHFAEPTERSKGEDVIGYYVLRDGHVFEGRPGQALFPGDSIQFVYSAPRSAYVAILSVDGERKASIYYPRGPRAAPIEQGRRQALPQSTVLDETLGTETLYGLSCETAVMLEPLRAELEAHPESGPHANGCLVSVLMLHKERP